MNKLIILILCIMFLTGCNTNCIPGCSSDCYNQIACTHIINEYNKYDKISNLCMNELISYIKENNLSCLMDQTSFHPLDTQRQYYKCCKQCFVINENGSDTMKSICKVDLDGK